MRKIIYEIFDFIIILFILCISKIIAFNSNLEADMIWTCGAFGGIFALFIAYLLQYYRK